MKKPWHAASVCSHGGDGLGNQSFHSSHFCCWEICLCISDKTSVIRTSFWLFLKYLSSFGNILKIQKPWPLCAPCKSISWFSAGRPDIDAHAHAVALQRGSWQKIQALLIQINSCETLKFGAQWQRRAERKIAIVATLRVPKCKWTIQK